ncbi:MAG TPA: hypothetical protein VMV72_20095 [Verrucomicrobiae bacterium]|nr:hypothetical protein [Verrucomicrobiae bacterium]
MKWIFANAVVAVYLGLCIAAPAARAQTSSAPPNASSAVVNGDSAGSAPASDPLGNPSAAVTTNTGLGFAGLAISSSTHGPGQRISPSSAASAPADSAAFSPPRLASGSAGNPGGSSGGNGFYRLDARGVESLAENTNLQNAPMDLHMDLAGDTSTLSHQKTSTARTAPTPTGSILLAPAADGGGTPPPGALSTEQPASR